MSGMDAMWAETFRQLEARNARLEEEAAQQEREEEWLKDASIIAQWAAATNVIRARFPDHPLLRKSIADELKRAARAEFSRSRNWPKVADVGKSFRLPDYDYGAAGADVERQLGLANVEIGRLKARVAELEAAASKREALVVKGNEEFDLVIRDLAQHMTLEHAYRAALEKAAPDSLLVRDSDTRVRLARHGYEMLLQHDGDWAVVKQTGREFVDQSARDSVDVPSASDQQPDPIDSEMVHEHAHDFVNGRLHVPEDPAHDGEAPAAARDQAPQSQPAGESD
jgi:hypothetical protein